MEYNFYAEALSDNRVVKKFRCDRQFYIWRNKNGLFDEF